MTARASSPVTAPPPPRESPSTKPLPGGFDRHRPPPCIGGVLQQMESFVEDVLGTSESGDQQIEADVATDDLTKEDGAETREGERQLGNAEAKSPSSEDT